MASAVCASSSVAVVAGPSTRFVKPSPCHVGCCIVAFFRDKFFGVKMRGNFSPDQCDCRLPVLDHHSTMVYFGMRRHG
uniref:Predicted protein n=1 Tax=Physcomitrium patens TaxID=3218 RepID=A9TV01_PHYPA